MISQDYIYQLNDQDPRVINGDLTIFPTSGMKPSDFADFEEVAVVGDVLFPMLFMYFSKDRKTKKQKMVRVDKWNKDLEDFFKDRCSKLRREEEAGKMMTRFINNCEKYARMFETVYTNVNMRFRSQLHNAVASLMAKYKSRLPLERTNNGLWYEGIYGKGTDWFPILNPNDPNDLFNIMESLRLLYENDIIDWKWDLDCRAVDLYSGEFMDEDTFTIERLKNGRILGIPVKGIFSENLGSKSSWMYHTFTGVDLKAAAAMGSKVTVLDGLTSVSWSVHRGKTTQRPLGKAAPAARSGGSRTIAGTLVFAVSDHNPLLDIIPDDLMVDRSGTNQRDINPWKPMMMPDQLPPFDITFTLMNEYGNCSLFTLYGVEISDEGGVVSTDNMMIENVFQYTAVAMDPIVQAIPDESGYIDPFGILRGSYSQFWKQREIIVGGVGYTDLQEAYSAQQEALDRTMTLAVHRRKLEDAAGKKSGERMLHEGAYTPPER